MGLGRLPFLADRLTSGGKNVFSRIFEKNGEFARILEILGENAAFYQRKTGINSPNFGSRRIFSKKFRQKLLQKGFFFAIMSIVILYIFKARLFNALLYAKNVSMMEGLEISYDGKAH